MKRPVADLRQNVEWGCEAVPNSHTFQPFQEPIIVRHFFNNLFPNGRCILSRITLSKNEKRSSCRNVKIFRTETTVVCVVKLVKGVVEIVCHV